MCLKKKVVPFGRQTAYLVIRETSVKQSDLSQCVEKLKEGKHFLAISAKKKSFMPLSLTAIVSTEAAVCGRDSLLHRFTSVLGSCRLAQLYEERKTKHCSKTCLHTLQFQQDPRPAAPKLLGAVLSYLVQAPYITHIKGHPASPPFGYTLRFS